MGQGKAPDGKAPRPFRMVCISIYEEDLQALDALVVSLKGAGLTQMSRSWLIREAVARLDVNEVFEKIAGTPTEHQTPKAD